MTGYQQALLHTVVAGLAIAAAVVLTVLGHLNSTAALAVVLGAAGISTTGIASTVTATRSVPSSPAPAQPAKPAAVA